MTAFSKLKICMVTFHACIRVFKESVALRAMGHDVTVFLNRGLPFGYNAYNLVSTWADREHLIQGIEAYDADVYHVHNEPDWLVSATRKARPYDPIVFDVHDLESLRWFKPPDPVEVAAFHDADGFIHVSEPCRKAAEEAHGNDRPTRVIYSWQPRDFVCPDDEIHDPPSYNSIVYEGGLDASTSGPIAGPHGVQQVNIRNFLNVFYAMRAQKFGVTIFSANQIGNQNYENMGACLSQPMHYHSMLSGLRPHGMGFVGAAGSARLMELAMPNKLFEYMSQGVVPICLHAAEAASFVQKHDCGIVLDGLKNLREQVADAPQKRQNVLNLRKEIVMENQVGDIVSLYDEVIK